MNSKYVEFKIAIENFDRDAWKRLQEARKAVSLIEEEITKAYEKSDRLKAVRDLAGYGNYGNKYMVVSRITGDHVVSSTTVDLGEEKPATYVQPLNIGEKTVNALLTGKLLTDGQKRALIKRLGVDLDTLVEGEIKPGSEEAFLMGASVA